MTESDLITVYREYLACLNGRQWDSLGQFVADRLHYNGKPLSLSDYRAMLIADTRAIPDLEFRPQLLLADDHVVSARLYFECTPRDTFLGFEPTGGPMAFPEHVFYRFDDGRIVEVWSLIDKESIREQLSGVTHPAPKRER